MGDFADLRRSRLKIELSKADTELVELTSQVAVLSNTLAATEARRRNVFQRKTEILRELGIENDATSFQGQQTVEV
jgi:hypothetical protein